MLTPRWPTRRSASGAFYVGPGSHSLDFVNKAIWNGTDSGSVAFFRLETVSLTKADCKANGWASFGTMFENQGQCVALSNRLQHQTAANVGTVTFAGIPFGTVARGLTPPVSELAHVDRSVRARDDLRHEEDRADHSGRPVMRC